MRNLMNQLDDAAHALGRWTIEDVRAGPLEALEAISAACETMKDAANIIMNHTLIDDHLTDLHPPERGST